MKDILKLIAKIILLILSGYDSEDAVNKITTLSGYSYFELWSKLPNKFKK
ncbi:hypothetical protein [Caminicella sporogenes]|nr:hypothetical protein [Caminicella sporogenes]WIF94464.1 hypothetical protein QNI18_09360 [Caminicella sporogenes]